MDRTTRRRGANRIVFAVLAGFAILALGLVQPATASTRLDSSPAIEPLAVPPCGDHVQVSLVSRTNDQTVIRVVAVDMRAFMPPNSYGLIYVSGNGISKGSYNVSANNGANFTVSFDTRTSPLSGSANVTDTANTYTICYKNYTV